MRVLLVATLLMLSPSGCMSSRGGSLGEELCGDPTTATTLDAQDVLVLRPNHTYVLKVEEDETAWGRLSIQLCEPMALHMTSQVRSQGSGPQVFSSVRLFPEASPHDPVKEDDRWTVSSLMGGCQLGPRAGPREQGAIFGISPLPAFAAGLYYLVAMGSRPSGEIEIRTGDPASTRELDWALGRHPELRVERLQARTLATNPIDLPPRTERLEWSYNQSDLATSSVRMASWSQKGGIAMVPSAGQLWDNATATVGAETASYRLDERFLCASAFGSGYRNDFELNHTAAAGISYHRRFEATAVGGPFTHGVAILNLPLEPLPR